MAKAAEANRRSLADRLWGRMVQFELPMRVGALVFVIASIASMSFAQLGFWSIGAIDGKSVYLMLILGPLILGGLLFGPITGALLGLYAGAVVFAHATFFPLDFYEVYFMSPLNTFGLLTAIGAVAGLLFDSILRHEPQGSVRMGYISVSCLGLSVAASVLMTVNVVIMYGGMENLEAIREYLLMSPTGMVVQALIDAFLMILLSCIADSVLRRSEQRGSQRTLREMFRNWMLLVSSLVFMIASATIFSFTTLQCQGSTEANMLSEVSYLTRQLSLSEDDILANLLDGYEVDLDGYVVITDLDGAILASDDEEWFSKGDSFLEIVDYDDPSYARYEDGSNGVPLFDEIIEEGYSDEIQAPSKDGISTMDVAFITAGAFDNGYVIMMRMSDMVYVNRFDTMLMSTLLAIALIASIAVLASALLGRVVVSRIDETNDSLDKITQGDLNERVRVHDSREFASLSAGINTTVAALKDSITEAEQKNAQELATAKAIQESVLPTDFPAFPDIDKFDLYASMKTAKEVGGDFYDFFQIEGTTKIGFVMADVSGKGIPAALFMMTAKTQVRTYMETGLPIDEAINAANHQLCLGNEAGMFVTMVACVLDYETGALAYVNAGHNPPLMLHDGSWEWMREVSGMPLGLFDGIPYDPLARQLEAGDMLYLYTDGVSEAMDVEGNLFGEERLANTLRKYIDFNPRSVCVGMRRAITDFTLDCEQSDDITMLGLKYGVPPEEKAVMVLNATTDQLVHVCNYIHAELHRRRAPKSVYNPIDIAAEELFVNVCHYAYPQATPDNPGEARISFEYSNNPPSLTVQIADDGIPYNPLSKPDAVTPDDIMDVPIGGLGILMAKQSVDDMSYERVGESNVVTIVKKW